MVDVITLRKMLQWCPTDHVGADLFQYGSVWSVRGSVITTSTIA